LTHAHHTRATRRNARRAPSARSVQSADNPQLPLLLPCPAFIDRVNIVAKTKRSRAAPHRVQTDAPAALDQILTTRKVIEIVGRHRCTLYRWMMAGQFPKKHSFRGRTVGWRRSDVEKWLAGDEPASH
jgi:prophage regulatory protein